MNNTISYCPALTEDDFDNAKQLFQEYALSIGINLEFQQFEKELQIIKEMYGPPSGGIILVKSDENFMGCIGIRKISDTVGEIKRMYIKPAYQKRGLGRELLYKALELAKSCGYNTIRLDTLQDMVPAIRLYKEAGFYEIPAYYFNPMATAVYFEKQL